jgi:hypothetical protein
MPDPNDGDAGPAVPPADPKGPYEADQADPGVVDKTKAEQQQTNTGKYGSVKTDPLKPPATDEEKAKRTSWIEVELLYDDGDPVAGEPYRITLPDGQTVAEGTLDEKGFARLDAIEPGTCQVTFPKLDGRDWTKK